MSILLENIKSKLERELPQYDYFYRKNLSGKHLIVRQSWTVGMGIWDKAGTLKILPVFPSYWVFLLGIGSGFVLLFNDKKRQKLKDLITKQVYAFEDLSHQGFSSLMSYSEKLNSTKKEYPFNEWRIISLSLA